MAEALQNSVDSVNRRYSALVADKLGISVEKLEEGIDKITDQVLTADTDVFTTDYNKWAAPTYVDGQKDRFFEALSIALSKRMDEVRDAYTTAATEYQGRITITRIDNTRSITVQDNGTGFSLSDLRVAVKKGASFKHGGSSIGELGNGLTYLICACDSFELETSNGTDKSYVRIDKMYSWINNVNEELKLDEPLSNPVNMDGKSDPYAIVRLQSIRKVDSDYPDLFGDTMTTKRLIHLIRTKTAIGHLYEALRFPLYNCLRSDGLVVEIVDNFGGVSVTQRIDFGYEGLSDIVRELVPPNAAPPMMTLDNARAQVNQNSDIGGNSITHIGIYTTATGHHLYYVCFLSNREWYKEASKALGLCDYPSAPDIKDIEKYDLFPGIELGVKGMPTGTFVDPPVTGFQGYWGNFHIMILDNRLKFDEGRKTPVGRRVTLYKTCADNTLFKQIGTDMISRAIKDANIPLNLAQMMKTKQDFLSQRLNGRVPLGYSKVKLQNIPKYEQDVIALFHEMIGANVFEFYHSVDCSSNSIYDAIFKYKIPKNRLGTIVQLVEGQTGVLEEDIIVEFKHRGEKIIDDIIKNVKFYYMMDLLICWDIDSANCKNSAANLISKPLNKVKYWGTTHELQLSATHFMQVGNGRSLDVISLKHLIQLLESNSYNVS